MAAEPRLAPPKLLYVVTSFNSGGAEWGLVNLVRGGVFDGFDLTVAALVRGAGAQVQALEALGHTPLILCDRSRLRPLGLMVAAVRLYRLLRRLRPQALLLSLPHANLLGRALRPGRDRPLVLSFEHNSHLAKPVYELGYRLTSGRVDWLLADCSATARAAIARLYHRSPRRVDVAPLVEFAPERLGEPRRRPGPGEPFHLVSAARLTATKDQARLVAILAALRRRGLDVRLTVFGEGPLRSELEAAAKRLGVGDRLSMPGHTPQWWRMPADLFVLTSRHEGLCIAALDAMAAGLPVAAPAVGGLQDYGAAAGMLQLDGDDLEEDAEHLSTLLQDAARLKAMGAAGRVMVAGRYEASIVRATYADIGTRLLDVVRDRANRRKARL